MPFRAMRFLVVVPKRAAMPLRVSLATTVYVVPGAVVEAGAAGAAGAAAAAVPATVRTWPIRIEFALVMAFKLIKFLVVVPNLAAMPLKVSLATTV